MVRQAHNGRFSQGNKKVLGIIGIDSRGASPVSLYRRVR